MVRCGGFHGFTGLPRDVHHQTHRKSYEPQSEDPEEDKEGDGVDGGGVAHGGGQEADRETLPQFPLSYWQSARHPSHPQRIGP